MNKIPKHPKLRGEWAEVHFLARASEHGLHVSKPYGDCLPYDFIVEDNGRMLSVQVKSTSYMPSGRRPYSCHVRPLRERRYPVAAVDFLAAYIIPEDHWYIIPYTDLDKRKLFIPLDPGNRRNCYEKYFEAWNLLSTSTVAKATIARNRDQARREQMKR